MSIPHEPMLAGRRILAIDDDEDMLATVRMMLQAAGAECETAKDGRAGLAALPSYQPHMILLDHMMPQMAGPEVCRAIRTESTYAAWRHIPILMLTAKTDNIEEQQTLFQLGLDAYLAKPFGFRELINVMSNIFTVQDVRAENSRLHGEILQVRNYLESIFDHITDIVSVQDTLFRIQTHNRFAAQQGSGEPLIGQRCHEAYFGRSSPCPRCPAVRTLADGVPQTSEWTADGAERTVEVDTYPIRSAAGEITTFVEIIKDTTERNRLQRRLGESSRLASLGTLAAGVAHEINNPLCIILGFAQSLNQDTTLPETTLKELAIIEQEAMRCARTVQDLLSFAKPSAPHRVAVHVVEIVRQCLSLVGQLLKKNGITVETDFSDPTPSVSADLSKMQQVFVNILINSIQAMPSGGRLTVSVRLDRAASRLITDFRDTGLGIRPEDLARVFDPFFTTKFGTGTGLGLAISRAIVEEHGGVLSMTSTLHVGTTVTVSLPLDQQIM